MLDHFKDSSVSHHSIVHRGRVKHFNVVCRQLPDHKVLRVKISKVAGMQVALQFIPTFSSKRSIHPLRFSTCSGVKSLQSSKGPSRSFVNISSSND
jgi:hypothetical protein